MKKTEFEIMLKAKGWIGVDLDGTLAEWSDETSMSFIGKPVEAMVNRVKRWIEEGRNVRVFTARVGYMEGHDVKAQQKLIREWLIEVFGELDSSALGITAQKDLLMLALWDDLAVPVQQNTGAPMIPVDED